VQTLPVAINTSLIDAFAFAPRQHAQFNILTEQTRILLIPSLSWSKLRY